MSFLSVSHCLDECLKGVVRVSSHKRRDDKGQPREWFFVDSEHSILEASGSFLVKNRTR